MTPTGAVSRMPQASGWTPLLLALPLVPAVLHLLEVGDRVTIVVLDLLYLPICVVGLALSLSAARRGTTSRWGRGPWRWVALAFAGRLWGEAWWSWSEVVRGTAPFPSVADIGFVAFYPLLAIALLRFPVPPRRRAHRAVLLLDVLTVAASACVLLWHVLLSDLVAAGVTTPASALTLVYTLGDVLLVLVAARIAVLGPRTGVRVPVAVVLVALGWLVLADVLFGREALTPGTDRLGPLVDVAWTAALVLLAVAADLARRAPLSGDEPVPTDSTASELPPAPSLLPYGAALSTLVLVGMASTRLPLHPYGGLLMAAIVVVLAVVVRQVVVGREHARLVALYESAAIEDTLTGALTRRRLLELGGRLTARGRAAIFVIDVDHFKSVNDTHGHLAGDVVLTEVAQRCTAALRPGDLLGRYGGDEFVAVLPGADPGTAMRVAERMHAAATGDTVTFGAVEIPVSLSVGVASAAAPESLPSLVDRADAALYAAKATGRGRVISADTAPGPLPEPATAQPVEPAEPAELDHADLQRAIAEGHLAVHYQPRLALRSGRMSTAEALVRWHHPTRGLLDARSFLPALQSRDSLVLLTERVLALALADCAAWRSVDPDVRVAINLPSDLLDDPWLPVRLVDAVAAAGLPADALELEIPEDALGGDERAARVVAELRSSGLRIAVDDFGTGATSLTTLRCHTLDVLKIDPSLLGNRLADPRDLAVIRAVASLGHELGLTVVAEGVEDVPARDLLTALGVDEVQGHLISRPVPAAALLSFLAAHRAGVTEAASLTDHVARVPVADAHLDRLLGTRSSR